MIVTFRCCIDGFSMSGNDDDYDVPSIDFIDGDCGGTSWKIVHQNHRKKNNLSSRTFYLFMYEGKLSRLDGAKKNQ